MTFSDVAERVLMRIWHCFIPERREDTVRYSAGIFRVYEQFTILSYCP